MLTEIIKLMKQRKQLSLRAIAIHFRMESSAVEPMMDILLRKGKVKLLDSQCLSGSCSGCSCTSRDTMLQYALN